MRPRYAALACATLILAASEAQTPFDKVQRDRSLKMLHDLAGEMRKHYYEPAYNGVDMEAKFTAAEQRIQKANNNGDVFSAIAESLAALNDSHTFFEPPTRATRREFGYVLKMVGDACYIVNVRPKSDAAEKLAPGDRVLSWEGYAPTRQNLWSMTYAFNTLYAATSFHFKIARPDGVEKTVEVMAKLKQDKRVVDINSDDYYQMVRDDEVEEHLERQRNVEFGDALIVWKMPSFEVTDEDLDRELKLARRHQALILDLRGNPGGYVKALQYLVGGVMDHDVTIADRKGRKSDLKPMIAKKRSPAFQGKLIVLIDSRSASAAELFSRVVQLEGRGTVLGDLSSGSVMEARYYPFSDGADRKIFYGASITDADLTMKDGKSLEHTGVTPDQLILPTAQDLAQDRDPVLSRAAQLAGVELDPVKAGKLFPFEWRPN
jgi:C-terminal processing protease CtpA/Prc